MVERSRQEGAIIYTLLPAVQEYAWGVRGRESLVARLSARDIDEKKHYAEVSECLASPLRRRRCATPLRAPL